MSGERHASRGDASRRGRRQRERDSGRGRVQVLPVLSCLSSPLLSSSSFAPRLCGSLFSLHFSALFPGLFSPFFFSFPILSFFTSKHEPGLVGVVEICLKTPLESRAVCTAQHSPRGHTGDPQWRPTEATDRTSPLAGSVLEGQSVRCQATGWAGLGNESGAGKVLQEG